MTQVPASSHGGGLPLTGGTLTGALVVAPTSDAVDPLDVETAVATNGGRLKMYAGDCYVELTGYGTRRAELYLSDAISTSSLDLTTGSGVAVQGGGGVSRQDVGGANNIRLTAKGVFLAVHAAPADGDLTAGECALWFDQTDGVGNTKLMVKGKSADGTVKTATVLLA